MGCTSCSTGNASGCGRNGSCSAYGCGKMSVFDWLSDMDAQATDKFDVVEVRFKNGFKGYFRNKQNLELHTGDMVVVDVPKGHHIGHVSLQGELVRLQMRKKNIPDSRNMKRIYRIAQQRDLDRYEAAKKRELPTLTRARQLVTMLRLDMKLSEVEYQGDNTKATFYYTTDKGVSFSELVRLLSEEFGIRIEMRQLSLRQEAGRVGGIGSCGRELCCSTWLTHLKTVSTKAARYQNLALNPGKLAGQCGRLKCCLNYELDTYMEALKDIPRVKGSLMTEKGAAKLQKTDIFGKKMWFSYAGEDTWHSIDTERVKHIIKLNGAGEKPASLTEDEDIEADRTLLNNDLEMLDKKYRLSSPKRKKRSGRRNRRNKNNSNNSKKPS